MKWLLAIIFSPLLISIALGLLYAALLVVFIIWWIPYEVLRDSRW